MSNLITNRGPIMIGVSGHTLSDDDVRRLKNPNIGGVILFRRNFSSVSQVKDLIRQIKKLRFPELIIAVDHEGGRVQRFKEGFTRIPSMGSLGKIALNQGIEKAKELTKKVGFVLAFELKEVGVDFSFTPVLDLDFHRSSIIGDRSFGSDVDLVIELSKSLIDGLRLANMTSCGKHFPGHGFVEEDSHLDLPIDSRDISCLEENDLIPFKALINYGIDAIMPAHIIYNEVDSLPASFSEKWLKFYLKDKLNFKGVIFSDDLNMQGAKFEKDINNRAQLALRSGCDIVLICNDLQEVDILLENNKIYKDANYAWYKFVSGYMDNYTNLITSRDFKILQEEINFLNENNFT